MAADFWAGYISGAIGILVGNPLDLIKVRLQASPGRSSSGTQIASDVGSMPAPARLANPFTTASSLIRGATAPILGYGALNALLFVTYNRSLSLLSGRDIYDDPPLNSALSTTFLAGAIGGLVTVVISAPTELIKCRAQLSSRPVSSYAIACSIVQAQGMRGLYYGGVITALRDSVGYGFYFWSYELGTRMMQSVQFQNVSNENMEVAKILLCGGMAGVITWASVFPLDVIKTRIQTQSFPSMMVPTAPQGVGTPLLCESASLPNVRIGAWDMAKRAYHSEGHMVFFRGLGVCSIRAFVVNAVQWAVYEWMMQTLKPKLKPQHVVVI